MQALERPRFRHDHLIAELVEADDGRFVDVMDPDSGNMFRFYEVEYSIACGMDGERDVAGILKWAQDELGLTPSATEVQAVIATLSGLQFIDTTAADGNVAKAASTTPALGDELAAGVVVAKAAAAPVAPSVDVELGHSGAAAAAASSRAVEELPKADYDLGAPGVVAAAKAGAVQPVDDIGLGASGARPEAVKAKQPQSEVSIDLSDHLSIKPDDVKEAVRASKVMTAVEMPKDLLEEDNAAKAAAEKAAQKAAAEKAAAENAAAEKAAAEKAAAQKAAAEKAAAQKAAADAKAAAEANAAATKKSADEKKAAQKPAAEQAKQPEKKVEKKAEERAKSVAPPAPSSGPNAALVILLILAMVGAGAFFVWKYVINKPDEAAPSPSSKVVPAPAPVPPPPPDITATLNIEAPSPAELKAGAAGEIESIEPADKDVKAGDTIAWLAGAKALQAEVAKLTAEVEKLQPAVTKAEEALSAEQQKENNEKGVTSAQKKLDAAKKPLDVKQSALTQKQGELDKLAVKAPLDGKLVEPAVLGAKLEAGAVIAKVAQPAAPVVSFKLPPGVKLSSDGAVNVASTQPSAGAPVACKVVDSHAETIKVACPADPSLAGGSTVKLVLPK